MSKTYQLTCHVDERWVREWGGDDSPMKFCFGSAMNGTHVGMVAFSDAVARSITVEWEDEYHIAASRTSQQSGTVITAATNYTPIDFGQEYVVNSSWVDSTASNSTHAPDNGFLFKNLDTPAAAVVAKKINGQIRPFYISPVLLPPAGKHGGDALIPTSMVAVWFQMDVQTGTMVEHDTAEPYVITMDTATKKIKFDYNGVWSVDV